MLQNRFQLASHDPREFGPLRDLAAGIFSILPHTPVTMLGLSKQLHFKMPSVDSWHAIGHLLAPKEHWITILETPGLRSMLMEGRRKEVLNGGTVRVRVEPSARVAPGLYIEINEEFKAPDDVESEGARWVPDLLTNHWDSILEYSEVVAEHLLGLVRN